MGCHPPGCHPEALHRKINLPAFLCFRENVETEKTVLDHPRHRTNLRPNQHTNIIICHRFKSNTTCLLIGHYGFEPHK